MAKDVAAKNWAGLLTLGTDGRYYSDPDSAPTEGGEGGTEVVQASNYDLELVWPRQSGTAPSEEVGTPNFPAAHRILKAYPNLAYNVQAYAMGGSLPYTWSLDGDVNWLSIDPDTGVISGTAPNVANGTQYTETVTVEDAEGTIISEPWTITVTTAGFKFVDAVGGNDSTGTGAIGAPWATFDKMRTASSAGDITYFLDGTYSTHFSTSGSPTYEGYNDPQGNWRRTEVSGSARSVMWLAYPGASPVFDGAYDNGVEQGSLLRVSGNSTYPTYIDGIEFQNYYHIALQLGGLDNYVTFRNLDMHDVKNSFNGANSSAIDSLSASGLSPRYYVAYQGINFHDNAAGAIKLYWQYKTLMEYCTFESGLAGIDTGADNFAGGPDHKGVVGRFEVRYNRFKNNPSLVDLPVSGGETERDAGFGGNMNLAATPSADEVERASGECRYNTLGTFDRPDLRVIDMNNFSNAGAVYVYRNTGVGKWNVQNSDAGIGPFRFYNNIIVNDTGAASVDRITFTGNVPGSGGNVEYGTDPDDNITFSVAAAEGIILDADTLELIGDARAEWLGSKGAEFGT